MVRKETLPNGVRVITETVPHVQSVTVGIWVDSGARDENTPKRGISHFLEHMLFKGTETRTAKQIACAFDSIGGQLNAFTDKEYTCYFGKVLSEHLPLAVDVLSDMLLNSQLDPSEIALEKNVVLEEIRRYEDTPDDLIHDIFAQTAWEGHPLGNSILGTNKSVGALSRNDLIKYIDANYAPNGIVVAAAGNLAHDELVEKISSIFGHLSGTKKPPKHAAPSFSSEMLLSEKDTEQVHFCIGTRGFSQLDPDKYTLALIDTTLGGGMSSRLFQEIRESRGLAYAIGSYSSCYREGGLFTVYGGTGIENVEEVFSLIRVEFSNVLKNSITEEELSRAKNQIKGALVLSQESMSSRMIRIAKSDLFYGRIIPLDEMISKIMSVTRDNVARVAQNIFAGESYAIAAIGPFKNRKVVM